MNLSCTRVELLSTLYCLHDLQPNSHSVNILSNNEQVNILDDYFYYTENSYKSINEETIQLKWTKKPTSIHKPMKYK